MFLLISKCLEVTDENCTPYFIFSLGLGPLTISLILRWLLFCFPMQEDEFYIFTILLLFFVFFYIGRQTTAQLKYLFIAFVNSVIYFFRKKRIFEILFGSTIVFLMGLIFIKALWFPIHGNDPLGYARGAQLLYSAKSIAIFPFTDSSITNGYYAASAHPLGYMSLMVWGYVFQGGIDSPIFIKIISPVYTFYTLVTVSYFIRNQFGLLSGLLGSIILLTTPIYFTQASLCHIDPIRMYSFFVAFLWIAKLFDSKNYGHAIWAGYALGLCLFSHAIGVLALPIACLLVIILGPCSTFLLRFKLSTVLVVIAIGIGGVRYIENYISFGALISDKLEILQLQCIDNEAYIKITRGIFSQYDRVVYGLFKGFTKVDAFGFSYWSFILSIILGYRLIGRDVFLKIVVSFLVIFYLMVVLSICIGIDTFIKNDRYIMTVQPFVAYVGGILPAICLNYKNKSIKY